MMSSIHSQSSDLHANDQEMQRANIEQQHSDEQIQQQPNLYNGKTPAIQEVEEEEMEEEDQEEGKEEAHQRSRNHAKHPHLRHARSHRSSSNSTSSSNSNTNSNNNSNKSTITFEKQKVVPPRARAQSAQSVLSNLSLRSLLLQNNLPQQQPQQPPAGNENPSTVMYGNLNQQIQSPAMSSSIRRKCSNNVLSQKNSSENEIGLQLPFTDDKRMDLDPRQCIRRNYSKNSILRRQHSNNQDIIEGTADDEGAVGEPLAQQSSGVEDANDESYNGEDDEASQKKLTEKALKNLTFLRNKTLQKAHSESSSQSSDRHENINENSDNETFDNITTQDGSMTHLQFGNKKVILDSSSFINDYNNGFRANLSQVQEQQQQQQQQQPQQQAFTTFRKPSLDVIQQPALSINSCNGKLKLSNKKNSKQISNPKKPLYTPAVLRDTAETNITIDDLVRPNSPQHTIMNNSQLNSVRNNHNSSSQASVYSTTSSILETCRKKISSFLFSTSEFSSPDLPYGINMESPAPPRKDHWLADSKRASCHYCHKLFTFLERKHHCRHCGDIFCSQHLAHWLYLNSNAEFIIGGGGMGTLSKICDGCLEEYEDLIKNPSWKNQKKANQSNEIASSAESFQHNNIRSQNSAAMTMNNKPKGDEVKDDNNDTIGSVVGSVPADWNWSSF